MRFTDAQCGLRHATDSLGAARLSLLARRNCAKRLAEFVQRLAVILSLTGLLAAFDRPTPLAAVPGGIVINEIHYHPPDKTEPAQFIELYNAGDKAVDLSGWKFYSGVQFTFPAGARLAPDAYFVVAQNTNFFRARFAFAAQGQFEGRLSRNGEKLVLQTATGQLADEVDYRIGFPWPTVGVPPGSSIELVNPSFDNSLGGNWRASPTAKVSVPTMARSPTPGQRNSLFATNAPPQLRHVAHTPDQPRSGQPVLVTVKATDADGVASLSLQYQAVDPGRYIELRDAAYRANWVSVPMRDDGKDGDANAGDEIFSAKLPATIQTHRRLIRYRITATDKSGDSITAPYADDPQPNFAYFVYDGVPAWRGAIQPGAFSFGQKSQVVEFGTNVMSSLPVYHLLSKKSSVEQATWRERYGGKEYKWSGTLVYDGQVYDHVRYRMRGGSWRYAMGKNMWKFDFNRGHDFQARDHHGKKYRQKWTKLNLGACIQQGDYGHRGEQGMFEAVGFRLFNLAGVEAPHTHYVQFRIIDDAAEAKSQYEGDFWGLYLAVEQPDGRFLSEHGLPDGNFYKMEFGAGELANLGVAGVKDKSDLNGFMQAYHNRNLPDGWWRKHFDLPRYYSYRAVVEAIHHYDIDEGAGKNYYYYLNPQTGRWSVHPWDIDLTWSEGMYGGGGSPFKRRVLPRPAFSLEFKNRVRELRDLLFNTDQAFQLIDEYAAVISNPQGVPSIVQADRARWDYSPVLADGSRSMPGKSGQGLFYEAAVTKDFHGMMNLMKAFVVRRSALLDSFARDNAIPKTPAVTAKEPANFPAAQLSFRSSAFEGDGQFAALEWRVAEVSDPKSPAFSPRAPRHYEINAVWESGEITTATFDVTIPAAVAKPGRTYRVRARMKDATGRWSHWSKPIQFTPAK